MLIDNILIAPGESSLPFEERRMRSFFIKGYGSMNTAPQTNEGRPSVQLKITPLSAVFAISDKAPRPLWEIDLRTGKLLSSRTQITLLPLVIRMACFTLLGNEAVLAYVLQPSQTLMHIVIDILLISLWLAFGVWGLQTTNRIYLMNLDAKNIAMKGKREEWLKTVLVVIGAALLGALIIWLKNRS